MPLFSIWPGFPRRLAPVGCCGNAVSNWRQHPANAVNIFCALWRMQGVSTSVRSRSEYALRTGFSSHRSRLEPRSGHVGFVALCYFGFPCQISFPPNAPSVTRGWHNGPVYGLSTKALCLTQSKKTKEPHLGLHFHWDFSCLIFLKQPLMRKYCLHRNI
jgi:hypothetical protein